MPTFESGVHKDTYCGASEHDLITGEEAILQMYGHSVHRYFPRTDDSEVGEGATKGKIVWYKVTSCLQ